MAWGLRVEIGIVLACRFVVQEGRKLLRSNPRFPSSNTKAAWPKIAKMAKSINLPGCRIGVREQSGETIILVGIAVAIRSADFNFGA
jgi:hypothetical protein